MKAFTIATSDYLELSRLTAACFEWSTGLRPTIVTDVAEPYEAKLQLPDAEQYVFFDADLLMRKRWAIPAVPHETFAAAPLRFNERALSSIRKSHHVHSPVLSTGLFVASAAHAPVMARALELMRMPNESKNREETWLSVALAEANTPTMVLPSDVNLQMIRTRNATGLHFCGVRGAAQKLGAVRHDIERHAPNELLGYLRDRCLGDFVRPETRKN